MSKLSRFAGLFGFAASKAEDDKDKDKAEKPVQREDESDEDFQKRLDKWKEDGGEEAENPVDTSENDQDKVDDKNAKAAADKARAEGKAEGVTAERARWDGVLASEAARGRAIAACSMLADTDMTAASITKALAALPAETGRSTLNQRTDGKETPAPGIDGGKDAAKPGTPAGFAAQVTAAVEAVRPSKKTA